LARQTVGKFLYVLSHQTIRLIRGRHSSPERGACVMEVASMLAGEPFSDEPRCVCPVIAEFLRTYNDEVDDTRRQDLFAAAALVVNTREDHAAERRRANICLDWWLSASPPRRLQLRRFLWMLPPSTSTRDIEIAHRAALWAAASRSRHAGVLELIEQLAGGSAEWAPEPDATETSGLGLPVACVPSR
jgi:hypothetical protein